MGQYETKRCQDEAYMSEDGTEVGLGAKKGQGRLTLGPDQMGPSALRAGHSFTSFDPFDVVLLSLRLYLI